MAERAAFSVISKLTNVSCLNALLAFFSYIISWDCVLHSQIADQIPVTHRDVHAVRYFPGVNMDDGDFAALIGGR